MTNKPKRRYRIRNRPDYNSALVRRGSLTLRVKPRALGAWREQRARPGRRRRRAYSDAAVLCAPTPREVYGLPPRATQGLVSSALRLLAADLPAPHYSTLSRRAATLEVKLPQRSRGLLHVAVGSTGVKLCGEGEWKVRLHGREKRRTWRKPHLLIDHATHEAPACSMTEQYARDRGELPGLLDQVEGEVREVLGDGAYGVQDCYRAIRGRGAEPDDEFRDAGELRRLSQLRTGEVYSPSFMQQRPATLKYKSPSLD